MPDPGSDQASHALLPWERAAILSLYESWAETDLSHHKLAHRGYRIGLVHVSESSVLQVLQVLEAEGLRLLGATKRERGEAQPCP